MEIAIVLGLLVITVALFISEKISVDVITILLLVILVSLKIITKEQAFSGFGNDFVIMLGSIFVIGSAIEKSGVFNSGSDQFLAHFIVHTFKNSSSRTIMAGFMILTVLLTQPLSNAAAALVMLPIGVSTAHELVVNERSFAIAIIVSASISMITPFEPACILVYGTGKYKFGDFVKIGGVLTFILLGVVWYLIPQIWKF